MTLFTVAGFAVHAGSWMVIALVPLMIWMLMAIRSHYDRARTELVAETPTHPSDVRHHILVPIASVDRVALQSLAYARLDQP